MALALSATVVIAPTASAAPSSSTISHVTDPYLHSPQKEEAPFGRCDFIEWQRRDLDTVRIYAFSDDLKKYFPVNDPYGLLFVVIHDANNNLVYEGQHNVSRWAQFDKDFTAYRGYLVNVTLTDDENRVTKCNGSSRV
jgi:hypothetical protein